MRVTRVLLLALGLFAVMATVAQGEGVARLAPPAANTERTKGAVIGASIAHPASWTVERERYTLDGAYGFTMASNYNTRPRAAEVLVRGDTFAVVRRREDLEDLVRGEEIPDWLK